VVPARGARRPPTGGGASRPTMPTERALIVAAFVAFAVATLQLPLRLNLVALGLALLTLALWLR